MKYTTNSGPREHSGLVVGAFDGVISDLDRTVTALAESKVLYLSCHAGRPMSEGRRSIVLGQAWILEAGSREKEGLDGAGAKEPEGG